MRHSYWRMKSCWSIRTISASDLTEGRALRKTPQQKRSREMVGRLLDATAALLAERGLDNTTTNHVAERAGVSIGSLYQYFPDKEALIEALLVRMGSDISKAFRARAEQVDIKRFGLREVVFYAITFGVNNIRTDPLVSEMVKNWNRLPIDKLLDPLEHFFLVMAQPYFLSNYQDYPIRNLEAKLYVVINSTLFTAIRYIHQENPMVREAELIETLTDMIVNLLEMPLRPAAPAPESRS